MEIASGLIKLKPGSESKVEEWRQTMAANVDEALATLSDEGIEVESWFRISIEGENYLLWYMRGESIAKAFEVAQTFKHPIDEYHFGLMDSITAEDGLTLAHPLFDPKLAL